MATATLNRPYNSPNRTVGSTPVNSLASLYSGEIVALNTAGAITWFRAYGAAGATTWEALTLPARN